ncbi:MAG TPA: ORF6N domain-containing protein [Bacteroidetes bacterium]|nr:ORF6N domain-containing protein [Bacteroidota bacterium]
MLIKAENIITFIFWVRGEKVMLDFHLAELYGVETRALKQAVRRNIKRFPEDFMFQLSKPEWNKLITNCDNLPPNAKFSPATPFAFTEQGVAMLSSVLRSDRAIEVNIAIMRTFVQLRKLLDENKALQSKIEELESKYDEQFREVFEAIRHLIQRENEPRKTIGFKLQRK